MLVAELVHEFYQEGLIISGNANPDGDAFFRWPWYRFTDYGKKVASARGEYQPHDAEGYVARLRGEIPNVDDVIVRYIDEASRCYSHRYDLAAAVMLGGASEKTMRPCKESCVS